jgi:hypothetical protein
MNLTLKTITHVQCSVFVCARNDLALQQNLNYMMRRRLHAKQVRRWLHEMPLIYCLPMHHIKATSK